MAMTHKDGSWPKPGQIFVFGSNLAGVHGAGAAHHAHKEQGAQWGLGFGPSGNTYAIPTKDRNIMTMPMEEIKPFVSVFLDYARYHPLLEFFVTRIGCGLAGYNDSDMAPLFRGAPDNCSFAEQWTPYLKD